MYREGESLLQLGRPEEAAEACALGMDRHAELVELPWMAAFASWQAGKPEQAASWARRAAAVDRTAAQAPRNDFSHHSGLREERYDVLRVALREQGEDASADEAERLYFEAKDVREQGEHS